MSFTVARALRAASEIMGLELLPLAVVETKTGEGRDLQEGINVEVDRPEEKDVDLGQGTGVVDRDVIENDDVHARK